MKKFEWQTISSVLLSIVLTVASLNSAFAMSADEANCPSVDLRNEYSFLSNSRDQKDSGWCYAYAGADLISATLNKPVSPFDIALHQAKSLALTHHEDTHQLTSQSGGSIFAAVRIARRVGVCSANKLNSDHPLAIEALIEAENLANFVQDGKAAGKLNEIQVQKLVFGQSQSLHYIFPTTNIWDLSTFYKNISPQDVSPILKVVDQVCQNSRTKIDLHIQSEYGGQKLELAKSLLRNHKLVEINWVARQLRDLKVPFEKIQNHLHASTIIGMQYNHSKKMCEFLIRNSYGDRAKLFYDPKLRSQAFNANIWLSEDFAKKIISGINWVN